MLAEFSRKLSGELTPKAAKTIASAVGLPAIVVRLSDLNWKHSPYVYLSERKEDDYVAVTPSRIGWLRDSNPVLHIHTVILYQIS